MITRAADQAKALLVESGIWATEVGFSLDHQFFLLENGEESLIKGSSL